MPENPTPKTQSKTPLIIGCVALLIVGILGVCVVGLGGYALLGNGSHTPTLAAQIATATSSGKTSATPVLAPTAASNLAPTLQTALSSSVFILLPDDTGKPLVSGSGTLLTAQGHILTNFHVVGDTDTGKLYNKQGLAFIGITSSDLNAKPTILYLAQVIKSDKSLDLAVLRIVATKDGGKLPADLRLAPVAIGDSDKVQIGDEISVIGFPGLGEGSVTLTKGTVAGFVEDSESIGTWIKTDAEINHGNSGGMAINKNGEVIGIPTATLSDKKDIGKIGYVRPVNFAKPLIQFAQRDAQAPVVFTFMGWSVASATRAPATVAGTAFSPIVICDDVKDDKPLNPRTTFPAGTKKVTVYWTYQGMTNGQEWGRRWVQDGQVIIDKPGQQWNLDESGWNSISLTDDNGLDAGTYEIHLFIGKTEVQKATFTISKSSGAAPTTAPQSAGSFGKIIFAQDVTDAGETVNPSNSFPAGTSTVWAYFTYLNLKQGDAWERKWLHDGAVLVDKSDAWDQGNTGWRAFSYGTNDGTPLQAGNYEFDLYLGGKLAQRATFVISTVKPTATPASSACGTIPAGMGGLIVFNYYDREINYTIAGKLYKIPSNGGKQILYLTPGYQPYSANIPNVGSANDTIKIEEKVCQSQSWAAQ